LEGNALVVLNVKPSQGMGRMGMGGNVTFAAVGVDRQVPVHVKMGVYEVACALEAPMAANSNGTIQRAFLIFQILLAVPGLDHSHAGSLVLARTILAKLAMVK
jgi:hypothetical protein